MQESIIIPKSLFKYGHFDENGYYKNVFAKNAFYFSSPAKFNDPFDCRVFPNYEIGSDKAIIKKLQEHIKRENPALSSAMVSRLAQNEFSKNIKIIRSPELMVDRMKEVIDNSYGILSLSETNDNLLMWSHYSKSHQGYCVEFNTNRINEIVKNYLLILKELILFHKISYESEYPLLNPYLPSFTTEEYLRVVTTKSKDWEYEKEWRLVYYDNANQLLDFPDDIIKSIYFGVNCSSDRVKECIELLRVRKSIPELFQAMLKQREYGIKFENIN
jgi:hypothetical protein